jgi:hypothetical protein
MRAIASLERAGIRPPTKHTITSERRPISLPVSA